ncbi:MAG: hypothetical protein JSR21_05445 [Proteobacteria bacterium]|nr:hypothetical protein [Pseudomonadota bacterium]
MDLLASVGVVLRTIGYGGAGLLVIAYFLNQRGTLLSQDWRFPALNLLGSAGLMASLVWEPNLPSIVIELFWFSISLYGMQRNLRAARRGESSA